ncbi:enoyl-CoA hydratase [Vibrio aestuarianus]|uniref:enoyl-CoA hydratase-related protein n=1 Tax=Vibrio aestuarianus TaxID=28171 RepID=UPI001558D023|nr:enoyl-CoA hydratase-related protein [Vibrio aestuarianus]NGZ15275.1 enoyl-CoA hydratase [Vibrio aestuarianus]NKZ51423.1 enoyl-CoA hydratase [Vibrio aestuarianus]
MMSPFISYSTESFITTMTINRPEAKNAINQSMYKYMAGKINEWACDKDTRVLVVTGSEHIFTSGNDINDFMIMADGAPDEHCGEFMKSIIRFPKPIITAVCGPAIGIGTTLLQYVDFNYISKSAFFMTPFVTLGLCPEFGSSVKLESIIGVRKARSMLLANEAMTAKEAVKFGFANDICDSPLSTALYKAKQLVAMAPESMIQTRLMLNHKQEDICKLVDLENRVLLERLKSRESKEAISAFIEKRKAIFH